MAVGHAIGALTTNQIPKTLALRAGRQKLLLVTRGDTRLDNAKFRRRFGINPRMVPLNETEAFTGQPVGGLGPFGRSCQIDIYCDESLNDFDVVCLPRHRGAKLGEFAPAVRQAAQEVSRRL
ncbi:YbaK/EbsC family protein [Streptomyces sp. NPDC046994]|uniref:YbaK/EbsC family protein n=1 Tax=Streptomyces sp. NPDC046994 TaxID=3155735 RepID=UPI003454EAE1